MFYEISRVSDTASHYRRARNHLSPQAQDLDSTLAKLSPVVLVTIAVYYKHISL